MNPLIKSLWIDALNKSDNLYSPAYVLNQLFEELNDVKIIIPNVHNIRIGKVIPEVLNIGPQNPIHAVVKTWAQLSHSDPELKSYHKIGGQFFQNTTPRMSMIKVAGKIQVTTERRKSKKLGAPIEQIDSLVPVTNEDIAILIKMDL